MHTLILIVKSRIRSLFVIAGVFSSLTASAQVSTNATNSTVRFRIAHGVTWLGDIDVELFDTLKPVTVSNFLTYAQSGRYAESLLHRLVPGFILEGGGFTLPTPFASAPFRVASVIPADPPITNEFNAGGVQANVLGTLAMAKTPGQPHSATSRWFFNLANNSDGTGSTNLNTANGGYTVFGRVTAGLSLLQQFNNRSPNSGLIDMTRPPLVSSCPPVLLVPSGSDYPFEALPVSFFNGAGCPNYTDLYHVDLILLNAPDVLRPTVVITAPALNASLTNADITVRGTVTDNVGVASVRVRRGTNEPVIATVTGTNWTALLTNVPPGTNSIVAEAIDTSGLRGQAITTFFRSVRAPVTLAVVGHGTIRGLVNQQLLEIGRGYHITARPDPSNLFAGWNGDAAGENPSLGFLMASNTAITAVFATNLFPYVKGTYTGLFFDPAQVTRDSSGSFTLTLASAGAYSAQVRLNGRTYPVKGVFSPDGRETNLVARPGTNSLLLNLSVDLEGGSDQLTGSLTNNQVTAIDTNGGWTALLLADRAAFKPPLNPAPQAGRYTVLIPPDAGSPAGPPGHGYGAARVQPTGKVSFSGALPEGTRLSHASTVSKHGSWPFHVVTGRGADASALIGWLFFTNDTVAETDLHGLVNWCKSGNPNRRLYPAGFTNETVFLGSVFVPGTPTNRVFGPVQASLAFTHGGLSAEFTNAVSIDAAGKVTNLDTNMLAMTIAKSTGLFAGNVRPPGATRSIAFKGAILQRQNRGAGSFPGPDDAGNVTLGE